MGTAAPAGSPPFIGRARELERMDGWLQRALAGELSVGFVAGEAGAGKTALVSEFARRAHERDAELVTVFGDCNSQTGIGDPYLPFREILAQLTGDVEGSLTRRRLGEGNASRLRGLLRASLNALVDSGPDLVGSLIPGGAILARLGGWATRDLPARRRLRELVARRLGGDGGGALQQSHLLEQYTSVLRALARHHPLVLILDDLHWADEASLGLLFHLGRRLTGAPVLIVGTYRPEEVELGRNAGAHPLQPVLTEFRRYFGEIGIELASDVGDAGRELLDALVDLEPNRLGPAFRRALLAHTGGHPLFTLELLQSLRERGQLACDAAGAWFEASPVDWTAVPARVEGVIEHRIGRLSAELRELLTLGSVEGEDFAAEVVARAGHLDERQAVARLSGELEKQHQLIVARELRQVGERRLSLYRFRHILFQRYLYSLLDPIERAYRHEAVACALEDIHGARSDDVAVQLARHWEEAGDRRRAAHYRLAAGEQARLVFSNQEAAAHLRRGLTLLGDAEDDDSERRGQRVRAWESLGDVLTLAGSELDARTALAAAQGLLAPGERIARARLHRKIANVWSRHVHFAEALAESQAAELALGATAEGISEADWQWEWLEVQLDRAWILYIGAQPAGLHALSERMQSAIDRSGTPEQRARLLQCLVLCGLAEDRYCVTERTVVLARARAEACEATGSTLVAAAGVFEFGFALVWAGQLDEAEATLRRALAYAERAGDLHVQTQSRAYLATVHRLRGQVSAAAAEAERMLALAHAANEPFYVGCAYAHSAWAAWRAGDLAHAEQEAGAALACWPAAWPFHWMALWPLLASRASRGDLAAALDAARLMVGGSVEGDALVPTQMPQPEPLRLLLEQALREWNAGEADEAAGTLGRAIALGRESGRS